MVLSVSLKYSNGRYLKEIGSMYVDVLNNISGEILFFYSDGNYYYQNNNSIGPVAIYYYEYSEEEINMAILSDSAAELEPKMPDAIPYSVSEFNIGVDVSEKIFDFDNIELEEEDVMQPFSNINNITGMELGCGPVYQTRNNTCWAAACASIIRMYKGSDDYLYTSHGICNQIHGFRHEIGGCTGGPIYDIQRAFNELGPVGVADYYVPYDFWNIRNEIYNEHYVHATGERRKTNGEYDYHALVINGYYYKVNRDSVSSWVYVCDSVRGRDHAEVDVSDDYFDYSGFRFKDMLYTWKL